MPPLFIEPVTTELEEIPETENVAVAPEPEVLSDHVTVPDKTPSDALAIDPYSLIKFDPSPTIKLPSVALKS